MNEVQSKQWETSKQMYILKFSSPHQKVVVELPHGKLVSLGRNKFLKFTDLRLSRLQMFLKAHYDDGLVEVLVTGTQESIIDGKKYGSGKMATAYHNSTFELIEGYGSGTLCFKNPNFTSDSDIGPSFPKTSNLSEGIHYCCILTSQCIRSAPLVIGDKDIFTLGADLVPTAEEEIGLYEVQIVPDYGLREVIVKNTGTNPVYLNGRQKNKADGVIINSFGTIHITSERLMVKLEFITICKSQGVKFLKEEDPHAYWDRGGDPIIYKSSGFQFSPLVAGFDLDNTLIKTESGKTFPIDADDWDFIDPGLGGLFEVLRDRGYCIVIFTNQRGLTTGTLSLDDFGFKIRSLCLVLAVPFIMFIAPYDNMNRKPCPGMWLTMEKKSELKVDYLESFYVGDAGGRKVNWKPNAKKDFSSADRFFAQNVKVRYITPEEFYLGEKISPHMFTDPLFDPRTLVVEQYTFVPPSSAEVIIMVGPPAAGKSFFFENELKRHNYQRVSLDIHKTQSKVKRLMEEFLQKGYSVVVDNTNPDLNSRKEYLALAKSYSIPVRCFWLQVTLQHAKHNNKFRLITSKRNIGDAAILSFFSRLEPPNLNEGFHEIIKINFYPTFTDRSKSDLYMSILLG